MQERIRIPDNKMDYYKDLAEMYVGDDVSPDFYGWVFPKYDHVAVGKLFDWSVMESVLNCSILFKPGIDSRTHLLFNF